MSYRTILVELEGDRPVEARLKVANVLAQRFEAALVAMHVMPEPFVPTAWEGGLSVYIQPEFIEAQVKFNQEDKKRVRKLYDAVCGTQPNLFWQEAEGDPARLLTEAVRCSDL